MHLSKLGVGVTGMRMLGNRGLPCKVLLVMAPCKMMMSQAAPNGMAMMTLGALPETDRVRIELCVDAMR